MTPEAGRKLRGWRQNEIERYWKALCMMELFLEYITGKKCMEPAKAGR